MAIVNSLRTGVDLVSDVGISQNIIHNKNADDPRFYNTAWTLQLIRGFVLWVACSSLPFLSLIFLTPRHWLCTSRRCILFRNLGFQFRQHLPVTKEIATR